MSDLVQQVQEALAAIPHTEVCAHRLVYLAAWGEPRETRTCTCDREQRIAQRVARMAMEMRFSRGHIGCAPMCEDCESRALAALRSEVS